MKTGLATINQDDNCREYSDFCDYLEQSSGITLGANKAYLVTNRLSSILKKHGINTLGEATSSLRQGRNGVLKLEIIDAMTTNETSWFRDNYPFEYLKENLLPQLVSDNVANPRIWSAACSYGHEAYSISMIIDEFRQKNPGALSQDTQIIATDISSRVLKNAETGVFDRLAMTRGLSAERKQKYFTHLGNENYKIDKSIKERVRFQNLNLLDPYHSIGKCDIIFCRNVLIYFSNENKTKIMQKFAQSLNCHGTLILGASETVTNYSEAFEMVKCPRGIVYRHT
ncbi:MAG: protein-glutamate O-methyltransferase CheR [Pseudomonadota bacterium]